MNRTLLFSALLAAGMMAHSGVANADAKITVVNLDEGTGQGLDDPTPADPIGGNPGTTRGDQAKVVFQFAADLWGSVLDSDVEILNTVTFQPLTCTETGGVLGSSGTNYIFSFNDPAPEGAIAETWYHSALTDALLGTDADATSDQISVLDVIMHEMWHGLGFYGFNNLSTGAMLKGTQDIYSTFVKRNDTGLNWVDITDAVRQASALADTHLVFTGAN